MLVSRPYAIAGTLAMVGAGLGCLAYDAGWWSFHDVSAHAVRGIDVSHHQGSIDWSRVHVEFAYIKATEGQTYVDPAFAANWRGAAGLARGAYHFYALCADPLAQVEHFLAVVPREPMLPPAIDLEFGGNCKERPAVEQTCADVQAFLEHIEPALGSAIIYATDDFLDAYERCLPRRSRWVRSIVRGPSRPWTLWQYANRGRIDGIEGPVDLDVFEGTRADFDRMLRTH